jgi:Fe-S-cluster-containing hydrogenase component 2
VNDLYYPLRSLQEGHWFKLICGASYQHLPAIRNLALTYTLAGADCVDVAADPAVIAAAQAGITAARALTPNIASASTPWLMVSFNDGEDPHFRKAEFDASQCPPDCSRPCERICPAQAIAFESAASVDVAGAGSGVIADRCYGCGRCLPICPIQNITARSYVSTPAAIAPFILESGIDAIEIHTQIGRVVEFQRLWAAIDPWVDRLKLVAISCPDGDGLIDYLRSLHVVISPLPCALIWQTDGRPMSGDIGTGTTRAAVKLGQKVLAADLPGFVQLAGGTNHHTVAKLRSLGLLSAPGVQEGAVPAIWAMEPPTAHIAGVAYGSYARTLLAPVLDRLAELEQMDLESAPAGVAIAHRSTAPLPSSLGLEDRPELLWRGVDLAHTLVSQLKSSR